MYTSNTCIVPLSTGADQEHKTDEMHTALMEACMDGHVEVARLLLDHGAQVQNTYVCLIHNIHICTCILYCIAQY